MSLAVCVAADGAHVLVLEGRAAPSELDAPMLQPLSSFVLDSANGGVLDVVFVPGTCYLLAVTSQRSLLLLDVNRGGEATTVLHEACAPSAAT